LQKTTEAEEAGRRGDSKTLYRIGKELSGGTRIQNLSLKKTDGQLTKTHEEEVLRWREHFEGILNCPEPTTCLGEMEWGEETEELEIDRDDINEDEVRKALKSLKNGRAAGNDGIKPELLKHGGETLVKSMTNLCNKVWKTGSVPKEWKEGIIIPLPKKGDLKECSNWRGITLLSVPGKIMHYKK
jgi:hypothetical protein